MTAINWIERLAEAHRVANGAASMANGGTCHPKAFRQLCEPAVGTPCDWELDVLPAVAAKAAQCIQRGQVLQNWDWVKEGAVRNRDQRLAGVPASTGPAQIMRIKPAKESAAERAQRLFGEEASA